MVGCDRREYLALAFPPGAGVLEWCISQLWEMTQKGGVFETDAEDKDAAEVTKATATVVPEPGSSGKATPPPAGKGKAGAKRPEEKSGKGNKADGKRVDLKKAAAGNPVLYLYMQYEEFVKHHPYVCVFVCM